MNLGSTYTHEKPVDPEAVVPDFTGMSVVEGRAEAADLGFELEIGGAGTGLIAIQSTAPGTSVSGITTVRVETKALTGGGDAYPQIRQPYTHRVKLGGW